MILRTLWYFLLLGFVLDTYASTRPDVVNIGSIFSSDSIIGKVAKVAIQAAVNDVNSSPQVLPGTKLNMLMQDSNYSGFLGIIDAMKLMEKNVVAIIGPQSSVIAHLVSHLAKGLQVPLLSFAATDPALSSLEYPFFVRTTQNDLFQMAAIADILDYYGWKEVTAIYTDDDYGRNGIAALGNKLAEKWCKISYKAPINPEPSREDIMQVLFQVVLQESRILVLHTYNSYGLKVLDVARSLHMLERGFVWIATNWLTDVIDSDSPLSSSALSDVQGLLTLRVHTPESQLKTNFLAQWSNLVKRDYQKGLFRLNTYGLYAYDTVWILAHALEEFFSQGGNTAFSNNPMLSQLRNGNLHLDAMSTFDGGELLLSDILRVNITGLTGPIQFGLDRNIINPVFDIINVVGTGHNAIGYWSNIYGLSVNPPEVLASMSPNQTSSSQQLLNVIWPGQTTKKPRGWVFPNNGKLLRIGVPYRVDYLEFIFYLTSSDSFTGYCIDVFTAAVDLLPYAVPYKLMPFGNGKNNPNTNEIIDKMRAGVFDAVIGDISIITNRTRKADFRQPYIESGLVVVAPVKTMDCNAWAFLRPFTPMMWCITGAFFIIVGSVVWILEHRSNDEFRGSPREQIATILWFSCSTWFFLHRENTVSPLGLLVLIVWLFVVLIINSSYTAGLTSMLTVQQLSSPVEGIQSLVAGNDPIGYQEGSFAHDYLKDELNIPESRLVALKSEEEYAESLRNGPKNGGVAAIVDERAYMDLFLSARCEFTIVGQEFTKNGWGFAFPRDSPLATDMSRAMMQMSENGDLQRIHDKWLRRSACSSLDTQLTVDRLELKSFWGLFLICGVACLLALVVYFGLMFKQFICHYEPEVEEFSSQRDLKARPSRLQSFLSFADEKEEDVKRRSKLRQLEGASTMSNTPRYASNRSYMDMSMNGSRINHMELSPMRTNGVTTQV